jgi:scyllo-inositol 2-dehydrogenase (NADP+)
MIVHSTISVLVAADRNAEMLLPFLSFLRSMRHVSLTVMPRVPDNLSGFQVVITATECAPDGEAQILQRFVSAGGGCLRIVSPADSRLPELFGAQPRPTGPAAELRVLFQDRDHPLAARLPDALYITTPHIPLDIQADDSETILYADWHYQHSPVLVKRRAGSGRAACTTIQSFSHPAFQQILYRLLRDLAGQQPSGQNISVGMLGYAPSVGRLHGQGISATPGLSLNAICDISPERLGWARNDFPRVRRLSSAEELADDPDVQLVIIATAPNLHARLCLQMMAAGKHVVCEKPLALNTKETAALAEMANAQNVHLSCHQNRRFDVDYLAIKQALADGLIGQLFFMETFVGGFSHPCGYWHSHQEISGGAAYDWGGHYLDWIVSLIPERVKEVTCLRHKRVWHDVTNADQERILIRFAGGQEAEFMHSDIAAIRKPKWYLLGTEGALIGDWRDVAVNELDPVLYYHERSIPATEMTPDITLHRRHQTGELVRQKIAVPGRQDYCFHRNLADHLLCGEPLAGPLEHSIRVVAILEAAARSAANSGTLEALDV